jgi:Flp pilus assembly protein TadG
MAIAPKCRRQRAQAMVEFAMVLLVTLTLIFGIIQASLALYAYSFVSYAARCGARYAMVRGSHSSAPATTSSVQTYVQSLAIAINQYQFADRYHQLESRQQSRQYGERQRQLRI